MTENQPFQQFPQKKSHTTRNVLLGVVGGFVLLLGGCAVAATVAVGGAAVAIDEGIKEVEAEQTAAEADVKFSGCGVETDDVLGEKIVGEVVITNSGTEARTYSVTIDVTDSAGVKAGTLLAFADAVQPGATYKDKLDTYAEDGAVGPYTCAVSDTSSY